MENWDNHAEGERDSQDSARNFEDGRGLPQPLGGDGPEPDSEPFSQSDVYISPTQARSKARCDTGDLGDIPVEAFAVPPAAVIVPGMRYAREKSVSGASARRKAKDCKAHSAREAEASRTTGEIDTLGKRYASSYALDFDELPIRMPKLPFASHLAVDLHEGAQLAGDGGYHQWLDHTPLPRPPKEGEEDITGVDKRVRSSTHPRIASRERKKQSQDIGADLYPMGFETRLPPFPQAIKIKIPNKAKNRHIEALKQDRALVATMAHVTEISEEDDEDSWAQEMSDSPRTITCGGTCRLDALVPLTGLRALATARTQQVSTQSAPSDVAMSGLSDFVGRADDKVLSYILEQRTESDPVKPKDKEFKPNRLAPGMPLPGQKPGFPLQL